MFMFHEFDIFRTPENGLKLDTLFCKSGYWKKVTKVFKVRTYTTQSTIEVETT